MEIDYDFYRLLAKKARENQGYKGGVVLILDGEVYGWRDSVRDPQTERPGSIAVDDEGRIWVARGGSMATGAAFWDEEDVQISFDFRKVLKPQ